MNLLELCQQFCLRSGIPSPNTVTGSTNTQILQIKALLEEEGADLAARGDWEVLTLEANHTTVATESQGAIATIASNGFRYVKNQTIWGGEVTLEFRCRRCGYWTGKKKRVPTRYVFHQNK